MLSCHHGGEVREKAHARTECTDTANGMIMMDTRPRAPARTRRCRGAPTQPRETAAYRRARRRPSRCASPSRRMAMSGTSGRTKKMMDAAAVSYTHLRAHETGRNLVCRLLLEKKK